MRAAAVRALTTCRPSAGLALAAQLGEDAAPGVRAELAVALAVAGEKQRSNSLLDGLLGSDDPADRAVGLAAAARVRPARLAGLASAGLGDPSARVRAAAAEAFAPALHAEGTDEPAALALLVAALDDDALPVRRAAAQTLAGHDLAATTLVEVLETGSERAQEAAVRGLEGTGDEGVEPVRAWARERVARMTSLRTHAAALGTHAADETNGASDDASLDFLRGLIARRGRRTEAQLLTAVATLGAPEATGLLRRSSRPPTRTSVRRRSRRSTPWATGSSHGTSSVCSTPSSRRPAKPRTTRCACSARIPTHGYVRSPCARWATA